MEKLLIWIKDNIKKIITIVNKKKHNNTEELNKVVERVVKQNKICNTHYSVIKLISDFKNIENDDRCFSVLQKSDDLYNTFEKYIIEHAEDEIIPSQKELKEILGIEIRKGIELRKKAVERGIVIQLPNKQFRLNKNSEILDKYNEN